VLRFFVVVVVVVGVVGVGVVVVTFIIGSLVKTFEVF
jgi:hypothetical protein